MNEHDVISRLSAASDRDLALHIDVDAVIASVKVQRKRRRAVAGAVLATAVLVAGLMVVTSQLDRDAATDAAAPGTWKVNSPDIEGVTLSAIAPINQSDVWAVGYLAPPQSAGLATHWDGAKWTRYILPKDFAPLDVSAAASNDVWAVGGSGGKPVAVHWDGSTWREVPVPARGRESNLSAVAAVAADDVWAAGDVGEGRPFIVHWDGQAWQEVTTPAVPGATGVLLRGIAIVSADDIWGVGWSTAGQPLSLHWDGRQWSLIPVPLGAGELLSVVASAFNEVWAVARNQFFRWEGSHWQQVHVLAEGYIMTIAPDGAGGLLAGGRHVVARRNGMTWALIRPPAVDAQIRSLRTTPDGVIWAVGDVGGTTPLVASISFSP